MFGFESNLNIVMYKFSREQFLFLGEEFDQNSCFSEYEIVKELGRGGFGKVFLGIHKTTKEKFAIKCVNTALIGI